ncbi:MAG TPA: phage portal protein [Candidatus Brocadiia bacterium]|nr:phage portal protein [Planctomycetota bacterium]MDO8093774.1 phage portal protein [Candidatus Brocadiales bacterium]
MGFISSLSLNGFIRELKQKFNRTLPVLIYPSALGGQEYGAPIDWRSKDYLEIYGNAEYSNVWVFACVKAIAQTVASVPMVFYSDTKNGRERLPDNHPLTELFWGVNPVMSRYDFWEATMVYLELTGNCFWALERATGDGRRATEIWPLRPDRIRIVPDRTSFVKGYIFSVGERSVGYDRDEVLHLKYFNPLNDWWGISPLSAARQGLLADYYAVMYNKKFFKQGASPSGVFVAEGAIDESSFRRLQKELELVYSGVDRAHRPMLLESGLKWQSISLPQKDMEFINQRKMSREEILSIFKVPPAEVGIFEYANYANAQMQDKIFWTKCIIPRLIKIEEHLNTFLIPRFGEGIFAKFDLSKVEALQENEDLKSTVAQRLVGSGIWTANEARKRLWNMEPL